jgi:phospholipid/cholesterol/gamma-HCH transport system substrate-binding protein
MKKDNVNYLLVGSFVLVTFAALLVLLYRITGRQADTETYYVTYANISGVQVGTAVTDGGYQIGQVEAVLPVRTGGRTRYKLALAVRAGWSIPADSVARIVSPGLLSSNIIDVREGKSRTNLAPGADIGGQEEVSIMTVLNSMAYELKDLSDHSIKPLLHNLDRQVGTIGSDLGKRIPQITANANALLVRLNRGADNLNALIGERNRTHVNHLLANAETVSANLARLSTQFDSVRKQLDHLLANSNHMVVANQADIRSSIVALRTSLDTVSRNINGIVHNLNSTSRNMSEFSRQIRNNPGLLLGSTPPADKDTQEP